MQDILLLDCTLRDGGYVNDWNFGHANLISIYERLAASGVDYTEVGFLDDRRPFDINRSIMIIVWNLSSRNIDLIISIMRQHISMFH